MNVFEDVLFGFLNQFEHVAIEVVAVKDVGAGGAGKNGAAQLNGLVGKKQAGGVDELTALQQVELGEGLGIWAALVALVAL